MALYAMADLHLSLGSDKPMDVFGPAWENYVERIKENWPLSSDDTIVIPGDVSWAMTLDGLDADFEFLSALPGKKIILKGNHDYWWNTVSKMNAFAEPYGNIFFLHNNSYEYGDVSLCGTRGWIQEPGAEADIKVLRRETMRLEASLASAKKQPIVFMHYPPLFADQQNDGLIEVMKKYGVKECYYGHLHGGAFSFAKTGVVDGISYSLISADYLGFSPVLVRKENFC